MSLNCVGIHAQAASVVSVLTVRLFLEQAADLFDVKQSMWDLLQKLPGHHTSTPAASQDLVWKNCTKAHLDASRLF